MVRCITPRPDYHLEGDVFTTIVATATGVDETAMPAPPVTRMTCTGCGLSEPAEWCWEQRPDCPCSKPPRWGNPMREPGARGTEVYKRTEEEMIVELQLRLHVLERRVEALERHIHTVEPEQVDQARRFGIDTISTSGVAYAGHTADAVAKAPTST